MQRGLNLPRPSTQRENSELSQVLSILDNISTSIRGHQKEFENINYRLDKQEKEQKKIRKEIRQTNSTQVPNLVIFSTLLMKGFGYSKRYQKTAYFH